MSPDGMLWDGRRVPFTLLGGYLGAGKTTIINHMVRNAGGRKIVVLVNDVAAVNVDAALIADHDGTTLSLTNGCVCCAIADDFARTLEQIREIPDPPDQVLMELSGVGEPARVAPWASTAGFRLDGVVVVADADQIVDLSSRQYVGDTISAQLVAADLVLLSKTDLADDGGAAARSLINGHTSAPVLEVLDGDVDIDLVLGTGRDQAAVSPISGRPGRYDTSVIELGAATRQELVDLVEALPADVVRAKGLVWCDDLDAPVEVHVVGRRRTIRLRRDLPVGRAAQRLIVITPVPRRDA